jgi:hypothetical protein
LVKLKSSLRKLYDRHHALVDRYGISLSQMTTDMFHLSLILPGPFLKGTLGSVASLLAATLYQGNPDRNHMLWNINWEIYTPYVGAAGVLLHINGKSLILPGPFLIHDLSPGL